MIDAIRKRRIIRAYLKRAVEPEKLSQVLLAAFFAPSSWGLRPWEFVVIKDEKAKMALSQSTVHARFVKDAPIIVVICYDMKKGKRFKEDSSIAAAHIMLEAENQGLGTCFVQVADAGDPPGIAEPHVKEVLDIPDRYRVQCMVTLGYPKRALTEHKDSEYAEGKVHFDSFRGVVSINKKGGNLC